MRVSLYQQLCDFEHELDGLLRGTMPDTQRQIITDLVNAVEIGASKIKKLDPTDNIKITV